jgi:hypothetical protein
MSTWLVLGVIAVLIAAILLEGRRQRRKYGPSRGTPALRAGILDLQRNLEPERKVEILLEEPNKAEEADSGGPPTAGSDD